MKQEKIVPLLYYSVWGYLNPEGPAPLPIITNRPDPCNAIVDMARRNILRILQRPDLRPEQRAYQQRLLDRMDAQARNPGPPWPADYPKRTSNTITGVL